MKEHSERIIWILLGFMFILLLRTAWVSEDAYITLRTVDNFVTGHGLTWNISERVQAFTHPLWMLLLSLIYFFTQEGFYTTIGLSVAFSMAAFLVIIWMMPRRTFATYAGISVLFFSKAYVDFSTSGLENPATHFLLACFLWFFLHKEDELNYKKIFSLSIIAGLATLNRMDTILFFIPPLLLILWEKNHGERCKRYC
jgi:arabinofuranosyltransferase